MFGLGYIRTFSWIFVCLVIPFIIVNGSLFSSKQEADITAFVENVMFCRDIPGLTLSVVKEDATWTKGFGRTDIRTGQKVTNETLFVIGSLGKAFTMTLLGILIEEAGYTWDTKLTDIEGLGVEFSDETITREATLADLLAHATGLSPICDYGFIGGYPANTSRSILAERIKYLPKIQEFRHSYLYNNLLYMLLGHVTELLGKDSWENLVTSRVFEPIGMLSTKTLLSGDDLKQEDVAKPYIMPYSELFDGHYDLYRIGPLVPAGGVLSNANDMAKWMRFNLKNGTTSAGEHLLDAALLQDAFHAQNVLPNELNPMKTPKYPINDTTTAYGYAWFISEYRGFRRIWHSGGMFSYVSLLWLFPDQQIGVFANINGPGKVGTPGLGLHSILSYVSDLLLEELPWLNHETACSFPSPWVNASDLDITDIVKNFTNDKLGNFVGIYGNRLLPDIQISLKERNKGQQYLWLEMNRIKGELLLTADEDIFKFNMTEPWEYAIERKMYGIFINYPVEFKRSETGQVESFLLTLENSVQMEYQRGARFLDSVTVSMATTFPVSVEIVVCVVIALVVLIQ